VFKALFPRRELHGQLRRSDGLVVMRGEQPREVDQAGDVVGTCRGVTLTAVVADAEYGDNSTVRQTFHRLRLPYALGISPTLTVFRRHAHVARRPHAAAAAQYPQLSDSG
jgi:hypothetical protein